MKSNPDFGNFESKPFFPPGFLEDRCVHERRILAQIPNTVFFSNVLKTKVAPNDKKHVRNYYGC